MTAAYGPLMTLGLRLHKSALQSKSRLPGGCPHILTQYSKIAAHVAAAKPNNKVVMLDCFAGIGGNAIAFALSGYKRVYAIEKNPAALACARHNARIYGVHDRITFFEGDCFEILGLNGHKQDVTTAPLAEVVRKAGIIFGSPPWGGKFSLHKLPLSTDTSRSFLQRPRSLRPK